MTSQDDIVMRLDNRWYAGNRFVADCRVWIDRHRAAQHDEMIPHRVSFVACLDKVAEVVERYEGEGDRESQLLLAEDLADMVVMLVRTGQLNTRTPPADAVEYFYEIGQKHADCRYCGERPVVVCGSCVHCYLKSN